MGPLPIFGELLETLDVIQSTLLEALLISWNERVSRSIDYHPGRSGSGADLFYYDSLERRKLIEPVPLSREASARTCPINVLPGWVHKDGYTERIPRDASLEFNLDNDPYLRPATATRTLPTFPVCSDDVGLVPSNLHRDDAYSPEEPA